MADPFASQGLGSATVLCWLAASDGNITPGQHKLLRDFAGTISDPGCLELALTVTRDLSFDDLLLACEAVQELPHEERIALMRWALVIASSDRQLASSTNYVLRFIADLVHMNIEEACQVANWRLPSPGDASSTKWWMSRDKARAGQKSAGAGSQRGQQRKKKKKGAMSIEEAAGILGLSVDSSDDAIAIAFRRLASLHHPDRFAQANEGAQREAAKKFAQIRAAFEALSQK